MPRSVEVSSVSSETVPLNQRTSCETIHHNGKTLYYCQKISEKEFLEIKKQSDIVDGWALAFIIGFVLVVTILMVWSRTL